MTYSANGLIQANDPNTFVNTTTNKLDRLWNVGSGDYGYGQYALQTTPSPTTPYPTVAVGELVKVNPWYQLYYGIHRMGNHQGSSITDRSANFPSTTELVKYFANVQTDLDTLTTNRRNAAGQGGTTTKSKTTSGGWSNYLYMYADIQFDSQDKMRYFFNAGGQVGVSMSHNRNTKANLLVQSMCANLGTLWLSSASTAVISGTSYSGTSRSGGSGGSVSTGTGFHSLGGGDTALISNVRGSSYNSIKTVTTARGQVRYIWGGDYTPNSYLNVYAKQNGGGLLTMTVLVDIVNGGGYETTPSVSGYVNDGNANVGDGTTMTCTLRMPSTTWLSDSWGTPSISMSQTRV